MKLEQKMRNKDYKKGHTKRLYSLGEKTYKELKRDHTEKEICVIIFHGADKALSKILDYDMINVNNQHKLKLLYIKY